MQVVSAKTDLDLLDQFAVVVDQDAEPVDLDEAVAEFLFKIVSQRRSAGSPAATPNSPKKPLLDVYHSVGGVREICK